MRILCLNCGSSSVKYRLTDWEKKETLATGIVERVIAGGSFIAHEVPGKDKLDQVTLPPEKDPGLDAFPHLPVIAHQALEPKTLMDLPVLGKHIDQLPGRFFDFLLIGRM